MDDWRWDGAAGTPMLVMLDIDELESSCTDRVMNTGYAVWDGGEWALEMDGGGCPELFRDMQAPLPLHTGGSHYKVYFSHHSDPDGVYDPDNKPLRVIHADTRSAGQPELLDFEDWEDLADARETASCGPMAAR
jgi:hypothetical protein